MSIHFRRILQQGVNKILDVVGLVLIRRDKRHQNFINLQETIASAEAAGLSVGDYIDAAFNVSGATQLTLDKMKECGVFQSQINTVCEIGPGSGRYLEKLIKICHPRQYEIYETAKNWRNWLKSKYPIIAYDADGTTLSHTSSHSVNLVHAHRVFVGLKIFEVFGYFLEMIRVCQPGGYIVFDVLTENCFGIDLVRDWLMDAPYWPAALIIGYVVVRFFQERGSELIGRFTIPMKPGITEYFVFKYHGSNHS